MAIPGRWGDRSWTIPDHLGRWPEWPNNRFRMAYGLHTAADQRLCSTEPDGRWAAADHGLPEVFSCRFRSVVWLLSRCAGGGPRDFPGCHSRAFQQRSTARLYQRVDGEQYANATR